LCEVVCRGVATGTVMREAEWHEDRISCWETPIHMNRSRVREAAHRDLIRPLQKVIVAALVVIVVVTVSVAVLPAEASMVAVVAVRLRRVVRLRLVPLVWCPLLGARRWERGARGRGTALGFGLCVDNLHAGHVRGFVQTVALELVHGDGGLVRVVKLDEAQVEVAARRLLRLAADHANRLVALALEAAEDVGDLALCRIGREALDIEGAGCVGRKMHGHVVGLMGLLHGGWAAADIRNGVG